jgi:hypothetical protein
MPTQMSLALWGRPRQLMRSYGKRSTMAACDIVWAWPTPGFPSAERL